jgi:hypothetical protein
LVLPFTFQGRKQDAHGGTGWLTRAGYGRKRRYRSKEVSPASREWQEFERRLRGDWERLFGLQLYGQHGFRTYGMGYRFTDLVSGSRFSANGPLSLDRYQFVWLEGDAGQDSQQTKDERRRTKVTAYSF